MVKIPEDTDTIVNLSGGFECLAALWYAKKKGYKPVCLALYNPNAKGRFADAELEAAKLQAKSFGVTIAGSEILGLIPENSMKNCSGNELKLECFTDEKILERRLLSLHNEQ